MRTRWRRGQSLVEFALILPILLVIILGVVDAGRMVYAYNAVSNAAREAGRTAIINQNSGDIRATATRAASGLNLPASDPGGCPAAGGPSTSALTGTCVAFRTGNLGASCGTPEVGCNAVVAVSWEWRAITPVISSLIGPVSVNSTTTQVIEKACTGNGCLDR